MESGVDRPRSTRHTGLISGRPAWSVRALLAGAVLLIVAAACAPAASPVPAAPAGGSQSAPQASTPPGGQGEWERAVAGARQEGKVVVSGPPGPLWREVFVGIERDYPGIALDYNGANSRDFWPRLFQERQAGQYLWDLRVGGPDPQVYQARDEGMLAPVRPLLLLPEVADEGNWLGGLDGLFADKENRYLPGFHAYARTTILVNRDLIPETELRSQRDLLDPRYKGRIVLQDPRGGAGLGTLAVLLAGNGEDYVRDLLSKQDVVVTGDNRQQAEWVVRGRYPIAIGLGNDQLIIFEQEGLKFNVKKLEEGPKGLNIGFGAIQLLDRAPHPNAAKVFVNWLLTQRIQSELSKRVELNSRRLDVAAIAPDEVPAPQRLHEYIPHQEEELLPTRHRAQQLATELVK
jgi:ABC-type Fe3+ transport system substrate-binding protein